MIYLDSVIRGFIYIAILLVKQHEMGVGLAQDRSGSHR